MVKQLLSEINSMDGVDGVFIATNRSEITNKIGTAYKDAQLKQLATHILRIKAGFHHMDKKVTELEFYWQNKYILCKNSDYFTLITFCSIARMLPLLRITLNVTMAKLADDKKFNKWLKSHIADTEFILRKGAIDAEEEKLFSRIV